MKEYIKKLQQYIAVNPTRFDEDCGHLSLF